MVLLFLFLYDLYYNDFVIQFTFYYLPFYFIYSLWKNTSQFLSETDVEFNFIIYERYYEEDNVLYVNTIDEEEEILLGYIHNNFKSYHKNINSITNRKEWDFF